MMQLNFNIESVFAVLLRNGYVRMITDKNGELLPASKAETSFPSVQIRSIPYKSVLVANATLLLIETAVYFLKRQIASKSKAFLDNGGFSERMARMRKKNKKGYL